VGRYPIVQFFLKETIHLLPHHTYSLWFHIKSLLGQQHGHQSTTLTSLFYKNIYWKVIYVYSYESNFKDKSIYMIFHIFKLNDLKVIHDLYS
jgi:hypothetical protein